MQWQRLSGAEPELVHSGFKCLDAIKHHLMIMEVTEAIGKMVRVCVSARVKGTFLCLPQKHGIKIASLISPARHKNNMQRRERKGKGKKNGTQAKTRQQGKFFCDFLECRSRFCPSSFFHNVAPSPLLFLTASVWIWLAEISCQCKNWLRVWFKSNWT